MKLVYGRAGSGKSYYCMNEIKENIENKVSNTLIYIVPEQYSLGAETRLSKVLNSNRNYKCSSIEF